MQKIVMKTATALGLKHMRKELRRVDLTFVDKFGLPVLAVEHENGWRTVFSEEIPKLLSSSASLRVLICYPPKTKYSEVTKNLESVLASSTEHWLRNEFLLILGPQRMSVRGEFAYFWYHPALKASELPC